MFILEFNKKKIQFLIFEVNASLGGLKKMSSRNCPEVPTGESQREMFFYFVIDKFNTFVNFHDKRKRTIWCDGGLCDS